MIEKKRSFWMIWRWEWSKWKWYGSKRLPAQILIQCLSLCSVKIKNLRVIVSAIKFTSGLDNQVRVATLGFFNLDILTKKKRDVCETFTERMVCTSESCLWTLSEDWREKNTWSLDTLSLFHNQVSYFLTEQAQFCRTIKQPKESIPK
jgi:hypothetical protein